MEKFLLGVLAGGVCGALLTANNYKMRTLVKKGQEELQAKFDGLMDEKIRAWDEKATELKEKAAEMKEKVQTELEKEKPAKKADA